MEKKKKNLDKLKQKIKERDRGEKKKKKKARTFLFSKYPYYNNMIWDSNTLFREKQAPRIIIVTKETSLREGHGQGER